MATHRYRSRNITAEQILFIRQLIADHPELSRWKLSRELCEAWQWKQAKWRVARYGVSRIAADVRPCGQDRVAAGEARRTQSDRGAAKA